MDGNALKTRLAVLTDVIQPVNLLST